MSSSAIVSSTSTAYEDRVDTDDRVSHASTPHRVGALRADQSTSSLVDGAESPSAGKIRRNKATPSTNWAKVKQLSSLSSAASPSLLRARGMSDYLRDVMRSYLIIELTGVTQKDVELLAEGLQTASSVTSVNLSCCDGVSDEGVAVLAAALQQNANIAKLNLSSCKNISDGGMAHLVHTLARHQGLTNLQLAGCPLVGDETVSALASALRGSAGSEAELSSLKSGTGVRTQRRASVTRLAADSSTLTQLERLRLRGAVFECRLRTLNLSGCARVSDASVTLLGDAIGLSAHIETILLHGCKGITDESVCRIAEGLKRNVTLSHLDLSWCENVGNRSLEALGQTLLLNQSLLTLKLACCFNLTDEGVVLFAKALDVNASLTHLDFSCCANLGEGTVSALAQALSKNRSLVKLHLPTVDDKELRLGVSRGSSPPVGRTGSISTISVGAFAPTPLDELKHMLERNRQRAKSLLISSRLADSIVSSPSWRTSLMRSGAAVGEHQLHGASGTPSRAQQLMQVLRAAIINGAAMYNANDFDGCLRLFKQTAESVIAATGSAAVSTALRTASEVSETMQHRIWALRSSFDKLLDDWEAESLKW